MTIKFDMKFFFVKFSDNLREFSYFCGRIMFFFIIFWQIYERFPFSCVCSNVNTLQEH